MAELVLDLDLDFFLDRIAHRRSDKGQRLDSSYCPWTEPQLRLFLEEKCLLSVTSPVKGKVVTHHDEMFWHLPKLADIGQIRFPLELVHVDAHADLGLGGTSHKYIMTELLHKPLEKRRTPHRRRVNPGNWLLFAVACRWISRIKFVLHPRWRGDLPWIYFEDLRTNSEHLQLKKFTKEEFEKHSLSLNLEGMSSLEFEPRVPFDTVSLADYQAEEPFSFVFLSHSPGYTPETADSLIPIVKDYIAPAES